MSRRLVLGLFVLVLALIGTIWGLTLNRDPSPSSVTPTAQRPAAPDAQADPPASETRSAAATITNKAAGAGQGDSATPPASPPVQAAASAPTVPPPAAAAPTPAPVVSSPPASPPPASPPPASASDIIAPPLPDMTDDAPAAVVHVAPSAGGPAPPAIAAAPAASPPAQALPVPAAPSSAATAPATTIPAPAPAVAVVTPPPPAPRRTVPSFDVVRVAPDGMSVIAGRAEPGAVVSIVEGAREIGRATADARGEWVVVLAGALAAGTRELALVSRGPGDIPELRSDRVVVVAVPERAAPQAAGTLAVSMPRDPTAADASRALQIPNTKPAAGGMPLALESVDYDARGNLVLGGRAPAGAPLLVYVDAKPFGRVTSDADGRWQLTPEEHLAPGVYTLRVDQLGADGRVVQRIELPFSRAEPAQEIASESDRIIVQPGNSLWRIARRVYGEGTRYTVIYQANRVMIRDPDLIYPGQIFAVPPRN